ncbi:MAG: VOC family protein [Saprospiraceae bacterium]|nr:VOC family protein [Saprospiraceae bacterium]
MTTVNVYLTFTGNCEEAFNFYKTVFGGEFPYVGRFGDMPDVEGKPGSSSDKQRIMHISLPISAETMLLGSDTTQEYEAHFSQGNNFSISITTDSREKADHFFKALSEGGQATMPMNDTFWGDYFGMLTDRFGINWMIGFNQGQQG